MRRGHAGWSICIACLVAVRWRASRRRSHAEWWHESDDGGASWNRTSTGETGDEADEGQLSSVKEEVGPAVVE
jgi:hypothetical protein